MPKTDIHLETTPPGSGVGDSAEGKMRNMSFLATVPRSSIAKSGKDTVDTDEAAPIPDIPKARVQQRKKAGATPTDSDKTLDKRKSRFSFMFGK